MEAYKQEFIEFMVESDVLKFGDFTLKSGRKSPFFMNAGAYVTGEQLMRLGEYYARAIHDNFGLDFDVVFGPAMCFNSEEECFAAYNADQIKPGTAVIIRYEGPKGGPGMKELHRVTEIMKGIPGSAVITDGRFSGASGGLSVGYLCPEAAEGGPIALIQDGDIVHIDLASNAISFDVSDEELEARRAAWTPVVHDIKGKVLRRYLKEVGPAKDGALLGC